MVSCGLLVRLDARHGQDGEVEEFLRSALPRVREEAGTTAWFAVRFGRSDYGIVDFFPDTAARDAHLSGPVADALRSQGGTLFDRPPHVQKLDVIAWKLPQGPHPASVKGLLLTFGARSGEEADAEQFLRDAQPLVEAEPKTTAWFAIRTEEGDYGIFDVFPDHGGRFAHLTGKVPRELAKEALSFLGSVPDLELPDVVAEKL